MELVVVLAVLARGAHASARRRSCGLSADLRLSLAASDLVGTLRLARSYALRHSANVAVKFRTGEDGAVTFALYPRRRRRRRAERATSTTAPTPRSSRRGGSPTSGGASASASRRGRRRGTRRSPRRPLGQLDDPIRFNRSDLASFGPLGTATPGSLYLTDGRRRLAAVRVFGTTGKVRVLTWDADERRGAGADLDR